MNETLFFLTIIVSFSLVILSYRLFGKVGMWIWMAIATIVANIEVAKCVDIFGLAVTLGNVIYGSTFLSTDILSENHSHEDAKKSVYIGFFFLLASTLLFQVSLRFIPNESDFASESMKTLFSLVPRFAVASTVCFFISNRIDVFLYKKIGEHTDKAWIKNNAATMTAQLLDSVMFTFLAFGGLYDIKTLWELAFTTYLMKVVIAVLDTPFLYWAKRLKERGKVKTMFNRNTE